MEICFFVLFVINFTTYISENCNLLYIIQNNFCSNSVVTLKLLSFFCNLKVTFIAHLLQIHKLLLLIYHYLFIYLLKIYVMKMLVHFSTYYLK